MLSIVGPLSSRQSKWSVYVKSSTSPNDSTESSDGSIASRPASVSLSPDTIWKFRQRDLAAMVVFIATIGGAYWAIRGDVSTLNAAVSTQHATAEKQADAIEKLLASVQTLAVAVGKLEARLDILVDRLRSEVDSKTKLRYTSEDAAHDKAELQAAIDALKKK